VHSDATSPQTLSYGLGSVALGLAVAALIDRCGKGAFFHRRCSAAAGPQGAPALAAPTGGGIDVSPPPPSIHRPNPSTPRESSS